MPAQPGTQPDRLSVNDPAACAQWTEKLDTTEQQLHDAAAAAAAVGDLAANVETHLKDSRSTTNADRMDKLGNSRSAPNAGTATHPGQARFGRNCLQGSESSLITEALHFGFAFAHRAAAPKP